MWIDKKSNDHLISRNFPRVFVNLVALTALCLCKLAVVDLDLAQEAGCLVAYSKVDICRILGRRVERHILLDNPEVPGTARIGDAGTN